jgi:hypothetical protein
MTAAVEFYASRQISYGTNPQVTLLFFAWGTEDDDEIARLVTLNTPEYLGINVNPRFRLWKSN